MSFPRSLVALAAGAILALSGRPLHAQNAVADSAAHRDTTTIQMLAPVHIRAQAPAQHDWMGRADAAWQVEHLEHENHKLTRQLAYYDHTIDRLQSHLDSLKTVVTDSLNQQIAELHAETEQARTQRIALEARLRAAESAPNSRP